MSRETLDFPRLEFKQVWKKMKQILRFVLDALKQVQRKFNFFTKIAY